MRRARLLARAFEGIHALAYFDREVLAAWKAVGLKGYWMGYFASRSAPMGAVAAATVEATFPSFAPDRIRRAIPDAWSFARPEQVVAARAAGMARALGAAWDDLDDGTLADVARRSRGFASGIDVPGARSSLPLFAANAALAWPDDPVLTLFHASTLVREHRGDLHMALLASAGVDGIEANVLAGAGPAYDRDWVRDSRGWGDDDWNGAVERLVDRGWITPDEQFTPAGRAWRSDLESRTDGLAAAPVVRLGEAAADALLADLAPLVERTLARLPDSAPQRGGG